VRPTFSVPPSTGRRGQYTRNRFDMPMQATGGVAPATTIAGTQSLAPEQGQQIQLSTLKSLANAPSPLQPIGTGADHVGQTNPQGAFVWLPPEMREQKWGRLDAAGLDAMAGTSRALRQEVVDMLERMDGTARTALWFKAANDDLPRVIDALLETGFDASAIDGEENTALLVAATRGSVEVAKILVGRHGECSGDGPSPAALLRWFAARGNARAVETLVNAGADVNAVASGRSTLASAIESNNLPTLKAVLAGGADVNLASPFDGTTPLLLAVKLRLNHIVQILLEQPGIKPDLPDKRGIAAREYARDNYMYDTSRPSMVSLFEAYDEARSHPDSKPWSRAAIAGDLGKLDELYKLHGKAIVDSVWRGGTSALTYAALHGRTEVAEALISWGADPSLHSGDGDSALHAAAYHNHLGVAACLVRHGAELDVLDSGGRTVLANAVYRDLVDMARLLLQAGANPNIGSRGEMETPLRWAAWHGKTEMCELLLEWGADPLARDRFGNTPHKRAGDSGSPETLAVFEKYMVK